MNKILIHKGDCTVFANVNKFLTFNLETELDLTGWQAKFILGWVEKTIDDISTKSFEIILGAEDTKQLRLGTQYGTIILTDSKGNIKTVTNTIPFEVTTAVVENEYQEVDLTIPESSGVDIKLKVGASTVTSVNGMTGDVVLDIPSLEGYVKNTDYATPNTGGVIRTAGSYGVNVSSSGYLNGVIRSLQEYNDGQTTMIMSKGTLENVKDDYVKRGVTENSIELTADEQANARTWLNAVGKEEYATQTTAGVVISNTGGGVGVHSSGKLSIAKATDDDIQNKEGIYKPLVASRIDLIVKTGVTTNTIQLTEDEKASAKQWLGFADGTDIMQAIASIPQFKLSIVEELPLAGEKMTLYLVSKGTESPDVYDEYIWIEETSSFEFLGTTAVDLNDYVKNTDYAKSGSAGIINVAGSYGTTASTSGYLRAVPKNLAEYNESQEYLFVAKGTLENIKDDYIKRGLTENSLEFTDEEKTSARTLIGAIGSTDYASSIQPGIMKVTPTYGARVFSNGALTGDVKTLETYTEMNEIGFVCKGTLDNVLTQYSKTVSLTQADYDALETVDETTLYLIEE